MPAELLLERRWLERVILDQMQLDPRRDLQPGGCHADIAGPGTGCQPSDSWKKATDRDTSRVARVICASAMPLVLAALGL